MSHSPPPPHWRGWVPPKELVQQGRGVSPRRMMAPPRRCKSIKCLYPHAGMGVRVRKAFERRGTRLREMRTLERGGARSREACTLERGGACSRGPLSGLPWWAAGPSQREPCPVGVLKQDAFSFGSLQVLSGICPVVLGDPQCCPPTVGTSTET
jgi:hypothetical protein